ncbi:MAG: DUF3107 domain-containing protein [Gaiella sp.]
MPDADSVRLELAFEGGQIIAIDVPSSSADEVERAVADGAPDTLRLETDDGRISISISKLTYVKRYGRDGRIGFGN